MNDLEKKELTKKFMIEMFPIKELFKIGFFKKEIKGDYEAMAKRVCEFFGYESVFEYGSKNIRCHITYAGDRPKYVNPQGELIEEPFITEIKSIYE